MTERVGEQRRAQADHERAAAIHQDQGAANPRQVDAGRVPGLYQRRAQPKFRNAGENRHHDGAERHETIVCGGQQPDDHERHAPARGLSQKFRGRAPLQARYSLTLDVHRPSLQCLALYTTSVMVLSAALFSVST